VPAFAGLFPDREANNFAPPMPALPASAHHTRIGKEKPIEIIMACAAGRISIGDGRYWARTSDPQLVELVLSQLS
jgi:hypothetical protein